MVVAGDWNAFNKDDTSPPWSLTRISAPGAQGSPDGFDWSINTVHAAATGGDTSAGLHSFAIVADARGLHADRAFTIRPTPDGLGTVVVSHETQVGPVAWLGRIYLAPRLHAANQVMFDDLARAAG